MLALVEGIKKLQPYLHTRNFTVVTDRSSLRWSLSSESILSILTMQLKRIISLLLFTVPYQVIPHWKGQKLNFQKTNISVLGNP